MLQVARLAPNLLHDAAELVTDFVHRQLNEDGGFRNRHGESDLYFTVFGIECLLALQCPLPEKTKEYIAQFGDGEELDLVHLACLARCHTMLYGKDVSQVLCDTVGERIMKYRSADGGFDDMVGSDTGNAYAAFIAIGALMDLGVTVDEPERIGESLKQLRTSDGGYTNVHGIDVGMVPVAAAAVTVNHAIGEQPDQDSVEFFLKCMHVEGGFFAMEDAPMPDLLSSAVAVHALSILKFDIGRIKEPLLDYMDTLWTNEGSFYAHWAEEQGELDCEYTFYALLLLGHLAVY